MDKKISREFRQSARAIKRQYGMKQYQMYERRVRVAIRKHPPYCQCPFHGGHK